MDVASNAAFTTSGALVDIVDKKVIVVLRDGKKLIGVLRSYDQYANLVLMDTLERIQAGRLFAEVPRGLFIIRGENVVLLGEIDLDAEDRPPPWMKEVSVGEVLEAARSEEDAKRGFQQRKDTILHEVKGFSSEGQEYDADAIPKQAIKRKAPDDNVSEVSASSTPQAAVFHPDVARGILDKLEDLTSRMKGVEECLRLAQHGRGLSPAPSSIEEVASPITTASHVRMGNPVSTVTESFKDLDDRGLRIRRNSTDSGHIHANFGLMSPDAISRGIVSEEQAQRYFQFFLDHCRYWVHGFVPEQLRDPVRVRYKSPILFGAVLCVSSYYLDAPDSEEGLSLYLSLVSLMNETLAPIVMSPRTCELDDDFILAVVFCIIWKAPRLSQHNMNIENFPQMQNLAKLNAC
ncbi:MAG: SM-like, degradation of cytoplasmic mRNAs and positively regulates transcription initiation [Cyphobasidiales sp. Tagirdzhanova-0007]|nr:MAG: SM-like, degradation of cytoplasmic mRNAs and positively regulates transcription initiation [Cyphobasidiales sp. Tagirdzhanova-0007]